MPKPVTVGYKMPLKLVPAVRETVAGRRLGAPEGGGGGYPAALPVRPWLGSIVENRSGEGTPRPIRGQNKTRASSCAGRAPSNRSNVVQKRSDRGQRIRDGDALLRSVDGVAEADAPKNVNGEQCAGSNRSKLAGNWKTVVCFSGHSDERGRPERSCGLGGRNTTQNARRPFHGLWPPAEPLAEPWTSPL